MAQKLVPEAKNGLSKFKNEVRSEEHHVWTPVT